MSDAELAEREQKLYAALIERYPNGFDGKSLSDLKAQNPDLSKWFSSTEKYLRTRETTLCEQLEQKGFFRKNTVSLPKDETKPVSEVVLTEKGLENAVNRVKMAVLQKYGFVRMFYTVKDANEDAATFCKELVEEVCSKSIISLITSGSCDEDTLDSEFAKLYEEETQLSGKLLSLKAQCKVSDDTKDKIESTIAEIENSRFQLEAFDDVLIRKLIECVKVISQTEIIIIFKGGYEVKAEVEKK